jgi:hypothetical protein
MLLYSADPGPAAATVRQLALGSRTVIDAAPVGTGSLKKR